MNSDFIEIEQNEDGPVLVEIFDDGTLLFRNFDAEVEAASVEIGFDPSISYRTWRAIDDNDIDTAMLEMVREGHIGAVRVLLFAGGDPHAYGNYMINTAALKGHLDIFMVLMEYGASPILLSSTIYQIVRTGDLKIIESLLNAGSFEGMRLFASNEAERCGKHKAAEMILSQMKTD